MSEKQQEIKWLPPGTAPKKPGVMIIGDFGNHYPQVATWNGATGEWSVAEVNVDLYKGKWSDSSFKTEQEKDCALVAWCPMQDIG